MSITTRLFVGNLPLNTNEQDLHAAFSCYGKITNLDLKIKSGESDKKKFAFVSLSASNYDLETCIKRFTNEEFKGNRLYVTRARESFLERLQRERAESQNKDKHEIPLPKKNPDIKLGTKLNPRKRRLSVGYSEDNNNNKSINSQENNVIPSSEKHQNKNDSDVKRIESLKKKRQEFKQKQMIIRTGLTTVDHKKNKKIKFSYNEDYSQPDQPSINGHFKETDPKQNNLFDNDDNDEDINFEIKEQYEGKKGQKILDLQSRYKSDKRFLIDERFIDDGHSDEEKNAENENIEVEQMDEKLKQLNILQDLLGVPIKSKNADLDIKKNKNNFGMLRFDPMHPEHAKYLAPIEEIKKDSQTKSKKKKGKQKIEDKVEDMVQEKVTVSKEQFYKVSETLKEAIAQQNSFSIRSLFDNKDSEQELQEQDISYTPIERKKKQKVNNPLDLKEKNPFVYDSSDSETEEKEQSKILLKTDESPTEIKTVWRENLFFTDCDQRLMDGLEYFNKIKDVNNTHKERRELKSLVKKRIYNKVRKSQLFQKKIGGKKKTTKRSFRK